LESLRSNKKGDTQKQDFAIPDQEPRIFLIVLLLPEKFLFSRQSNATLATFESLGRIPVFRPSEGNAPENLYRIPCHRGKGYLSDGAIPSARAAEHKE
ncbi:MAG TPA: hypothetical protein VHP35_03125, partial [Terriglobia bacterium]|nr:hypothetical protein [Terriglobia bacterium]